MREWIVKLVREAVRAEVADQLRSIEDKAIRTEAALSGIAVRVREKSEGKKPVPAMSKQWGARRVMLENQAETGS